MMTSPRKGLSDDYYGRSKLEEIVLGDSEYWDTIAMMVFMMQSEGYDVVMEDLHTALRFYGGKSK